MFYQNTVNTGYLYIFFNESFIKSYGEDVYKLGRTSNLKCRKSTYNTSFIKESEYLYTSRQFRDAIKAERVLFFILKKYRIKSNREFFKVNLEKIKESVDRVCNFTDDMIDKINMYIVNGNCSEKILERLEKGTIESDMEWNKIIEDRDEFWKEFKYRFSYEGQEKKVVTDSKEIYEKINKIEEREEKMNEEI
jgi:hypothetical protein